MTERTVKKLLLVGFIVLSAVAYWWAGTVVRQTRIEAGVTDGYIRSVGWMLLCAAERNGGAFPSQADEIWCTEVSAGSSNKTLGWPCSADDALAGKSRVSLPEALKRVAISFDPSGGIPRVGVSGRSSGAGTLDAVNGWLSAWEIAHNTPVDPPQ